MLASRFRVSAQARADLRGLGDDKPLPCLTGNVFVQASNYALIMLFGLFSFHLLNRILSLHRATCVRYKFFVRYYCLIFATAVTLVAALVVEQVPFDAHARLKKNVINYLVTFEDVLFLLITQVVSYQWYLCHLRFKYGTRVERKHKRRYVLVSGAILLVAAVMYGVSLALTTTNSALQDTFYQVCFIVVTSTHVIGALYVILFGKLLHGTLKRMQIDDPAFRRVNARMRAFVVALAFFNLYAFCTSIADLVFEEVAASDFCDSTTFILIMFFRFSDLLVAELGSLIIYSIMIKPVSVQQAVRHTPHEQEVDSEKCHQEVVSERNERDDDEEEEEDEDDLLSATLRDSQQNSKMLLQGAEAPPQDASKTLKRNLLQWQSDSTNSFNNSIHIKQSTDGP